MISSSTHYLVGVDERKTGDEVIIPIESWNGKVLRIVTDELEEGKHGKTSVLKFGRLALGKNVRWQVQNTSGGGEPSVCLDASDEGNNLDPSEEGHGIQCGDTVGEVVCAQLSGDQIVSETVGLGGDVSEDGELGDTAVLELGEAVFVELLLGDAIGEAGGVPETNGGEGTDLVLKGVKRGGDLGNGGGGKGGGRTGHGSEGGDLHHGCREINYKTWGSDCELVVTKCRVAVQGSGGKSDMSELVHDVLWLDLYLNMYLPATDVPFGFGGIPGLYGIAPFSTQPFARALTLYDGQPPNKPNPQQTQGGSSSPSLNSNSLPYPTFTTVPLPP